MRTAPPQRCCAWQEDGGPALVLPGRPWAVRLAGRDPAFGALEVYEADVLLDVVTSTRIAPLLLRGARAANGRAGPCILAWGRLPISGAGPEVEFTLGRRRPFMQPGTVLRLTSWCWLAVADGRFDRVTVRSGDACVRSRIRQGQP
ncbi:MAG TPA: hypothetical protein VKB62_08390 [Streptosporangiaceae bacterium]|nr:hypothetical protein [Streptosporangiaceae bacterium]